MRIVALLALRNEELYLERCIRHLVEQGVEICIIDNESTDRSRDIAQSYLGKGVFQIVDQPFHGHFDLLGQLQIKERLAATIDADWFIHHDADEIRQAPDPNQTLAQAIRIVDTQGYNAINFHEFTFIPTSLDEQFEKSDYVAQMHYYYFFSPNPNHRVNAWKKLSIQANLTDSKGHQVRFPGRKLSPVPFVLRHYIFLSAMQGLQKYGGRYFSKFEVEQLGWQRSNRQNWGQGELILPSRDSMKRLTALKAKLDNSDPQPKHLFSFTGAGRKDLAGAADRPT